MADNRPLASPGSANQGSYDTYVQGLTTQSGGQQQSNPVADARAKLQAQQGGNTGGVIRRLFGMAAGAAEVPAPQEPRGFLQTIGHGVGTLVSPQPAQSAPHIDFNSTVLGKIVNDAVANVRAGYAMANPQTPTQAVMSSEAALPPNPATTVGSEVGKTVAPPPVGPNPQPPMSPRTHTVDDFVRATEGMSWRQMAHLLPFAPPDMRNPQMQAQGLLNALTRTAVGINLQGQRPSSGLEQAIARAQNASGGGVGSLNPVIASQLRRGMAAE